MNTIAKKSALLAAMLFLCGVVTANAAPFRGRVVVTPGFIHGPMFYGPYWGPYMGSYYPYYGPAYMVRSGGDVKVEVTPKQAQVYVDGYYAGVVRDFDGVFHHLHTTPGGHTITLYLNGYRTLTESVDARPGSTVKLRATMEKLAPGEVSAPVARG